MTLAEPTVQENNRLLGYDKTEMQHFMSCRLGDACNTCKSFIEGFRK